MSCLAQSGSERPQNIQEIINILDDMVTQQTPEPMQISLIDTDIKKSLSTGTSPCSSTMAVEL
ncbi:hypothetical protein RintRC_1310 [Richelia intracellularis]|nr:hypothetical protein RintRC_1310 [Richelia intracellularis]